MTPEEAEKRLGFRVTGPNLEFSEWDKSLRKTVKGPDGKPQPIDYLGTARSGARPATDAEKAMWLLLTEPV